ncbi:MAG: HAD family hydrolase [Clostridium cadaveris]|uniref:Haloacid dehalogenase superfamily, subfamily IA, variant 3 with third motif having DD or ED/haloacid dehalogenase superfamily, subfamily IA, variant 1 with third motif having Dx(3-4)D or Dx(3-4)E n=1 Tax=Clostridium cadaveris TaxID=1529 RepID=A0A1I2L8K0_9CLOT|nr:HAD family hydrolase [Clostridium cadaveris]MDU4951726.1 HAD family hydrolase [Clostridium sp.]MDM8312715.1 HAD family hydrolase [Clostridium cadaveris]MDY4949249.1 HAD family hydrolase [Clostridium cadaveris]NME64738.1 HAD family hydrolase [Clostridium cadaveris]NWK09671.1 HAD family hydrolase [Clostridium cadaveris]
MKKYKCIIFDLDGTMLNTEEMNMIPLQRLIKEELNKDISYNDLLKYKAYSGKKTLELLGFNDIEKSYSKWVKYVNEYENGAELYDGFKEVIETLDKNNILCGISSSKTRAQYEIDFFKTGLQKYMKSVILAEDTENHKPHPEPLLKVAETLEVSPKEVIYVGDTFADYNAAKSAGMDFAFAIWGASDTNGIEADYNLNEPKDLLKVLGI